MLIIYEFNEFLTLKNELQHRVDFSIRK